MNSSIGEFATRRGSRFRLLALGQLALMAATWRLWIPQTVFPQIPLISIAGQLPRPVECGLLVLLLASLSIMLFVQRPMFLRGASLTTALSTLGLVCIDQHRLQPWAWQFVLVSFVLAAASDQVTIALWRWLVIGIYTWSAWSKMDLGFCIYHGPFLLDGFCKSIGLTNGTRFWRDDVRFLVAAAIPAVELSIAFGLGWRRTRRAAVIGAALMHIGLLFALGPFGHGHQPGVLIWNLFFISQNWFLFWGERNPSTAADDPNTRLDVAETNIGKSDNVVGPSLSVRFAGPGDSLAAFIVLTAMAWPLLEPLGLCDHWIAWAVYAAKPERVTVLLAQSELAKLPEKLKPYLGTPEFDEWCPIRLDRWSLDSVSVPIYPQDRFQIGVALALARDFQLNQLRIDIEGPAHWWTGQRIVHQYIGLQAVESLATKYRCNARPR